MKRSCEVQNATRRSVEVLPSKPREILKTLFGLTSMKDLLEIYSLQNTERIQ